MPRVKADTDRRLVTLDTGQRSVDIPTDGSGHIRRHVKSKFQVRAAGDEHPFVGFRGSFIPFGQRQWIGSRRWGYWETNVAGAIAKTIGEKTTVNNDITFNRDHDNRLLLARTSNGTLRLSVDELYGYADADMGMYSYTPDVVTGLERGDLTGMSYAFDIIDWDWQTADDGHDHLFIREMELFDTAVVGMPANVDTTAGLRADLMAVAREAGMDIASLDRLALRLSNPDPEIVSVLRSLSINEPPESTTRDTTTTDAGDTTSDETKTTTARLQAETLKRAHALIEETIR